MPAEATTEPTILTGRHVLEDLGRELGAGKELVDWLETDGWITSIDLEPGRDAILAASAYAFLRRTTRSPDVGVICCLRNAADVIMKVAAGKAAGSELLIVADYRYVSWSDQDQLWDLATAKFVAETPQPGVIVCMMSLPGRLLQLEARFVGKGFRWPRQNND